MSRRTESWAPENPKSVTSRSVTWRYLSVTVFVFLTFRGPLASHDSNPYPNRTRIARYNAISAPLSQVSRLVRGSPMEPFFGTFRGSPPFAPLLVTSVRHLSLRTLSPLTAFKNARNPKFVQNLSQRLFLGVPVRGTEIQDLSENYRFFFFFFKILTNFSNFQSP